MFRVAAVAVLLLGLAGCSGTPTVLQTGQDSYRIMGESEFSYTDMVNSMYQKANNTCAAQGKETRITGTDAGGGSIGFAGQKRAMLIRFRCI